MLLFLKLYLAHLVADFLLQPDWIAQNKTKTQALLAHSVLHVVVPIAVININLNRWIILAIFCLAIAHAICDYVKAKYTRDEWLAFTLDQLVHLIIIAGVAVFFIPGGIDKTNGLFRSAAASEKLFLLLSVYTLVVFGGGYFVQKVTSYFMTQIDPTLIPSKPGLPNAGKYIGWLERSLVLTFILTGYPDGIGFLLAGKALIRYPEIKDDSKGHFAEYFLIGTLTSVTLALLAGLLTLKLKSRL
jgi:hypothetical protein